VLCSNESAYGRSQTDNQFHNLGAPQVTPLKEDLTGCGKTIVARWKFKGPHV